MIKEWIKMIISNSFVINPNTKINVIKEDPTDNMFLETAIDGNVNFIISQDKHLLNIKEYNGIKILKPKEFLDILK